MRRAKCKPWTLGWKYHFISVGGRYFELQYPKCLAKGLHTKEHRILLWNCSLCWSWHQDNEKCKQSTEKNFSSYAPDEQNAFYCFCFLNLSSHPFCISLNPLESGKETNSWLLIFEHISRRAVDNKLLHLLGRLLPYDPYLPLRDHRDA